MSTTQTHTRTETNMQDGTTTKFIQYASNTFSKMTAKVKEIADKYVPPDTRNATAQQISKFAQDRPFLAAFILSNALLNGLPIFMFLTFAVSLSVIASVTATIFALIAAAFFVLFVLGLALLVLIPLVSFTTFLAVGLWLSILMVHILRKWARERDIEKKELARAEYERKWIAAKGPIILNDRPLA